VVGTRIEIEYTPAGNGFCIYLMKKDIEERVWGEIEEVELRRRFDKGTILYWSSADHSKDEEVFEWCENAEGTRIVGSIVLGVFNVKEGRLEEIHELMPRDEAERVREELERDKKFNALLRELRKIASDEENAYRLFTDYRGKR